MKMIALLATLGFATCVCLAVLYIGGLAIGKQMLLRRKHFRAAVYDKPLANVREAYNRFCFWYGIKVRDVLGSNTLSEGEKDIRHLLLKRHREEAFVTVATPITEEKYYVLIGYIMKRFSIPDTALLNLSQLQFILPGFDYRDCQKAIAWCMNSSRAEIESCLREIPELAEENDC